VTHYAGKEERKKIKPPFNNLFVKAFPNPDFSDEDLKVILQTQFHFFKYFDLIEPI
jgi:hypothetical protein